MKIILKEEKGVTLLSLTVTIVVIMILTGITIYYGFGMLTSVKLQDLRTNMLLIQAKAKEYVEEVSFQKANQTDSEKIEQIKNQNLKGKKISSNTQILEEAEKTGVIDKNTIDEYYYLESTDLESMGLGDLKDKSPEEIGYFIIKYDIENIKVEVINTKGYNGNYTLEQLNNITGE